MNDKAVAPTIVSYLLALPWTCLSLPFFSTQSGKPDFDQTGATLPFPGVTEGPSSR
jgi:hypothetical protein